AALKLRFIANFLNPPVISGFISASGILIPLGQLRHLLGLSVSGDNALNMLVNLWQALPDPHLPTLLIGAGSLALLYLARFHFKSALQRPGWAEAVPCPPAGAGAVLTLLLALLVVGLLALADAGVSVVGTIRAGLPGRALPALDAGLVVQLLPAALLTSLVGFVESASVGQTLAARRRERVEPNQELVGLGAANVAAAVSGGFPVTGGFARSVVNHDAGARTPMAGAFSAVGIALTVLFFTP